MKTLIHMKTYCKNKRALCADTILTLQGKKTELNFERELQHFLISISKDPELIKNENTDEVLKSLFGGYTYGELIVRAVRSLNALIMLYDGVLVSTLADATMVNFEYHSDAEFEYMRDAKYYIIEILNRRMNEE